MTLPKLPPCPVLLTREQAAKYLGLSLSTLKSWAVHNRYNLPFIKLGRHVRYRLTDLEEFLADNTQTNPDADIEEALCPIT